MIKEYVNVKVDIGTRHLLRKISVETNERIIAVVNRLASEELKRIEIAEEKKKQAEDGSTKCLS